jgi:hypothetical protein
MYGPHNTHVTQHELYERSYNNWLQSEEGQDFSKDLDEGGIHGAEQERYLRHYRIFDIII